MTGLALFLALSLNPLKDLRFSMFSYERAGWPRYRDLGKWLYIEDLPYEHFIPVTGTNSSPQRMLYMVDENKWCTYESLDFDADKQTQYQECEWRWQSFISVKKSSCSALWLFFINRMIMIHFQKNRKRKQRDV